MPEANFLERKPFEWHKRGFVADGDMIYAIVALALAHIYSARLAMAVSLYLSTSLLGVLDGQLKGLGQPRSMICS